MGKLEKGLIGSVTIGLSLMVMSLSEIFYYTGVARDKISEAVLKYSPVKPRCILNADSNRKLMIPGKFYKVNEYGFLEERK
jgi:hypothetical protein